MRLHHDRSCLRLIGGLMLGLLLLVTSCSGSGTDSEQLGSAVPEELSFDGTLPTEPLERGATIGVSMQNLSRTFFVGLDAGARGEAANLGATLLVADAEDDPDKQLADVEELIAAGVDGLILSPVDSGAAVDIAALAQQAGVPLIAVANQIGTVEDYGRQFVFPGTVALVTNDDVDMGQKAAELAAQLIGDELARIAVLAGKEGTANAVMRREGFTAGLDQLAIDYEIVGTTAGDWNADGGRLACEGFADLEAVTMIYSMSDAMTTGCVDALAEAGRADISIVSIGGNAEGIELLLGGGIVGTICQKPSTMGALAVSTMVLALETASFEQGLRFYETPVVTAENQTAVCNPQW